MIAKDKTHRLGPFWFELHDECVRFGLGEDERVRVSDLRRRPWQPLFSQRNGLGRGLTVIAGRWMVRVS